MNIKSIKTLKTGLGIPIVFLHGFLGKSEDWNAVCRHLPPCPCIGIDIPGHGQAPFAENFDIDIPEYHLVGYSMGGRIALQKFAGKAKSLTLISTHPGLLSNEEKYARLKNDEKWAELLLKLPIDEFLCLWYDQPIFKPFKPDFSMRREQNKIGLAKALLHFSLAKQKRVEIDEVIVGMRDEKFRKLFKNPTVVPNAGHMVHLENPKELARIIQMRIGI